MSSGAPIQHAPEASPADAAHVTRVVRNMLNGRVVPLLGAGVNMSGRPTDFKYSSAKRTHLPSGSELARDLAKRFNFKEFKVRRRDDLLRVSQLVDVIEGSGELYLMLHKIFDADYPPGPVHRFLARLQPILRRKKRELQVILTTNYDDALERAFVDEGEEYDLITYVSTNPADQCGQFVHFPPGATTPNPVTSGNDYTGLKLGERAVILKMHGAVKRNGSFDEDNYVITEDHYIEYLTRAGQIENLLPAAVHKRLKNSHFLFLGHGMADWNLRAILWQIWSGQRLDYPSWSIQRHPDRLDCKFWRDRNVSIFDEDLDEYVDKLDIELKSQRRARDAR
jgi:SIR2-like domain